MFFSKNNKQISINMGLNEEAQAQLDAWKFIFGWIDGKTLRCAVELEIPDILEKHGSPMSLSDLSSTVGVPSSSVYRIMRFLTYLGMFKKINISDHDEIHYAQSSLSSLFMREKLAPLMMLEGPSPGPFSGLWAEVLRTGKRPDIDLDGGEGAWKADFLNQGDVFTKAMKSNARVTTSAIINNYPDVVKGVGSLVDVGGRHGLVPHMLVEAFPHLEGICFDLPQVVANAPSLDGVKFVGGNMFESVPKADAVIIMRVLHDWSDEACIDILKKCREAVPPNTGKVMIVESIINEEGEEDEYVHCHLAMDMIMLAGTICGKERTYKEWVHIMGAAGFSKHEVINIKAIESVIEAYP